MGVFLDMRTSMNSATVGQPGLSLSESPTAFGTIGLQTQGVVNPIITLNGTVGVTGELGDTFVVELVRGFYMILSISSTVLKVRLDRTEVPNSTRSQLRICLHHQHWKVCILRSSRGCPQQ